MNITLDLVGDRHPNSLTQIHDRGFNLVRVPFHWEAYSNDIEGMLGEMEAIASAAEKVRIRVFFDSHNTKQVAISMVMHGLVGFLRSYGRIRQESGSDC